MGTITVRPRVGRFAGRIVETNERGYGIFTRDPDTIRQHRGTWQTPKFTSAAQFSAYLRRNYPSHDKEIDK